MSEEKSLCHLWHLSSSSLPIRKYFDLHGAYKFIVYLLLSNSLLRALVCEKEFIHNICVELRSSILRCVCFTISFFFIWHQLDSTWESFKWNKWHAFGWFIKYSENNGKNCVWASILYWHAQLKMGQIKNEFDIYYRQLIKSFSPMN